MRGKKVVLPAALAGLAALVTAAGVAWLAMGVAAPAGEVKTFTLTATVVPWEIRPGQVVTAWAYNGRVPGPELRVTEGDRVRVVFKNELPVATSVHWHGVDVPFGMDGVPGLTQRAVQPGETFTYEFVASPAGTRFYHTHGSGELDEALQMDLGLYGAFIIEPRRREAGYDREYTVILSEWDTLAAPPAGAGGDMRGDGAASGQGPMEGMAAMEGGRVFLINGKAWPYTAPLVVKEGERVRLRLINAGSMSIHPMHLHGHSFKVVAVDGNPLPAPVTRDVVTVAPGERYDIEFVADNPGVWLLHCHELHHADAGMVTVLQYEGFALPAPAPGDGGGH